ncbi:MAG: hypothetical protein AB7S77_11410 [Desulfatirhabdiaceae bacterium]
MSHLKHIPGNALPGRSSNRKPIYWKKTVSHIQMNDDFQLSDLLSVEADASGFGGEGVPSAGLVEAADLLLPEA